ncbi:sugar phosphate isomerase/epimerase family protein [Hominifimenecus sp. rT4P-3]|uniref:sugar phosphate isomerase/epimerase family protein n=1 Tax=Hominifimenecus sp. rT4P-3 TaxID=3242979 RepID=UPI003DA68C52
MNKKQIPLSCFGLAADAAAMKAAGYHEIELHIWEIEEMSDSTLQGLKRLFSENDFRCRVADNPLPLTRRIAASDFHLSDFKDNLKKSADRSAQLGIQYWNFGNGYARHLLPDVPDAEKKIKEAVYWIAELTLEYQISLLLEPIGHTITNYWNTLPQVVCFLKEMNLPHVRAMVDLRWQLDEGRPISELYEYAGWIDHAHIDNPFTDYAGKKIRTIPRLTDPYDYKEYLDFIKSDSYHGSLSIEALTFSDLEKELREALDFFGFYGMASRNG